MFFLIIIVTSPSDQPSIDQPSSTPSVSNTPSDQPSIDQFLGFIDQPSSTPSVSKTPSDQPSMTPSMAPSVSNEPSDVFTLFAPLREIEIEVPQLIKYSIFKGRFDLTLSKFIRRNMVLICFRPDTATEIGGPTPITDCLKNTGYSIDDTITDISSLFASNDCNFFDFHLKILALIC